MSAKTEFDTKILDDEAPESGYLSGPLSSQLLSSEELDVENEKKQNDSDKRDTEKPQDESDKKVISESSELDSGLDLSECLSNFKLSDFSQTELLQAPLIVEPEQKQQGIPLAILFRPDEDGDTQLHIAAVHGCEKSVGTLIRVCPDKILFDIPNDYGQTPLHLAVMGGHAVVTRMLVRAGASLGARDRMGETPLHKAVNHTKVGKHMDCLHALLAPVTEHPPRRLSSILDQKNYNGQAAVHLAASVGHVETLRALVSYGADINAREGLAGSTALHVAVRRGDAPTARWLLQRCGAIDRHAADYAGRTPRRLARRSPLRSLFNDDDQSDDDSDDEYEMYGSSDSDSDSVMEMLRQNIQSSQSLINVA